MDDFLDALTIILDIVLDGGISISSNKKISKWIRYPLIVFIILFFLLVIGGLTFIGICNFKTNIYLSIFLIMCSLLLLIACIIKFRDTYLKKVDSKKIKN